MKLKITDLETFCNDPELAGEAQAILKLHRIHGFALSVSNGKIQREVVEPSGRPYYFRSVEVALHELMDVPNLSKSILVQATNLR